MTQAEDAERLIDHALAGLNLADPAALLEILVEAEFPEPEEEYRLEAEEIARRIRAEERNGSRLGERAIAKIVRTVTTEYLEVPVGRGDARRAAAEICLRRVQDLVEQCVAEEAAIALATDAATLSRPADIDGSPAVELKPERPTAAELLISIDTPAQVTCMIGHHGYAHEIYSPKPAEIAEEVRILVRGLVAGTYYEEERDKRHSTTTRAFWPGGGSSTLDVSQDAGGQQTEWRRRAYDSY